MLDVDSTRYIVILSASESKQVEPVQTLDGVTTDHTYHKQDQTRSQAKEASKKSPGKLQLRKKVKRLQQQITRLREIGQAPKT